MTYLWFLLCLLTVMVEAGHYKGGTITWKPVDPYTNSSIVEVVFSQSHSWTWSRLKCNQSTINNLGWYTDGGGAFTGEPNIQCQPTLTSCTGSSFATISQRTYCTDFALSVQISSGSLITKMSLSRSTNILVGFKSFAWAPEIPSTSGLFSGYWRVMTRVDLTKNYPINSSPVTGSLPIIRVIEGKTAVIQIPAADWDRTNDVRCRWASSTGTAGNECDDVCNNFPGANLSSSACTITWFAVRRSADILGGLLTSTYVAAIMVEDFNSTTDTIPLSSVPLQMLIYTYQPASGACNMTPEITGVRPNRACIGVPVNETLVERIIATVYCPGDNITEFITISPLYMQKSSISPVSGTTNQWYITLTWIPTYDQIGPQVFCAAPIDQRGLTGPQHCINFVVGYSAPNLITPKLVQGSASPLGTVFANHSLFSIQATGGVYHPNRNGTYIQIFNKANPSTPEWQTDCGYSPDCVYSGQTVLFYVRNANWTFGAQYYILFGSGAASGNIFCAPESDPIIDPNFWNFNIWDPSFSSTTTTTTTPPTTGTVTTRPPLTTTPNASLTTTGIVATNGTTVTTTTITPSSSTSVTTVTIVPAIASTTEINVLTTKGFEEQCKQPVLIGTIVSMMIMMPVHMLGMFVIFTKIEKMFNPARIAATIRQRKFANRVTPRQARSMKQN